MWNLQANKQPAEQWEDSELNYMPWIERSERQREEQAAWQQALCNRYDIHIGEHCYISPLAAVFPDTLRMGDRSFIAAGAIVRNTDLTLGADCSVNAYAVIAGKVTIGSGVRIASHAVIMGFNHGIEEVDTPIYKQPCTSKGITIEDDVWIGAGVTIVDGVTIGAHSVIAGGAVVTKPIPPYSIAGGNPAKVIRSRLGRTSSSASGSPRLTEKLSAFGGAVKGQMETLLTSYIENRDGEYTYVNHGGGPRTLRAWCDAVELAALFGASPPGFSREEIISRLGNAQDPETGLIPDPWHLPDPVTNEPARLSDHLSRYHLLAVGYALETLGESLPHPVSVIQQMTAEQLYEQLNTLPWSTNAWGCGDWIDGYATGLYHNIRHHGSMQRPDALFGWLLTHADPASGMWGSPTPEQQWLQPVNGFYRLTRATYAQFGMPLPYPEAAIDTVLRHTRNKNFFREGAGNACNVLDVIHPLWLCRKQTDYRREEAITWAEAQIERVLRHWKPNRGFSFELEPGYPTGLMGTEMWLSILYLLADLCGCSTSLGYVPQGVHRPQPAMLLTI
ncbi:acyltransferase [Paenibacillus sp. GCM10023252]|uniref:acyltransferase n=1 Tax=Paenibacillus sp. GCM10023252 TaxID=3252649 RepID=UPI00361058CE